MLIWKQFRGLAVLGAVMAVGLVVSGPVSAQQAGNRPAAQQQTTSAKPAAVAQKPVFRARDLATPQERQAYRQAMRAARNDPARQRQLRDQMKATLSARASTRGGTLAVVKPARPEVGAKAEARPMTPPRAP